MAGGSVQTEDAGDGTVNINSQPSGAKIYIDDQYKGTTPFSLLLKSGNYTIRAEKVGYKSESKRIIVNSSKRTQLTFILDKQGGSLFIRSSPTSAKVYLNNQYQGESPLTLKGMDAGSYSLTLSLEGYSDFRQTVVVNHGRESQVNARLKIMKPSISAPKDMVLIPAGEFEMGSNSGYKDEKPVHRVYLDAFYIDRYEVTVAQYRACVNSGQCEEFTTRYWSGKDQGRSKYCNWTASGRENHPINCVDWENANNYCQYINKRLPTEAEWEKAATWKNGRKHKYPSGKNTVSCADAVMKESGSWKQNGGCGKVSTWKVGSKMEEINGTYDMAGNVWEWVADWYGKSYYGNSPGRNPTGPNSGSGRGVRGGSWSYTASNLRGAIRSYDAPSVRGKYLGFRCARSPK